MYEKKNDFKMEKKYETLWLQTNLFCFKFLRIKAKQICVTLRNGYQFCPKGEHRQRKQHKNNKISFFFCVYKYEYEYMCAK